MLSLEQCRKIDPVLNNLPDEEVIQIRENLYEAARLSLESWVKKNEGSKNPLWLLPNEP